MFYDIKWISSGAFEFEKKNIKQSLRIDPGTQNKLSMLNVIKQLQHFVQYDVLWSTVLSWSLLLFSVVTHHITLNEVQ